MKQGIPLKQPNPPQKIYKDTVYIFSIDSRFFSK